MQSRTRSGLLALIVAVGAARLAWAPPTAFVEGDDAALCAGIARLGQGPAIGPYAYHPPKLPDDPASAGVWTEATARSPSLALYRYDTMPGMYLIGRLTTGLGDIAERMSWVCFGAGTVLPLLVSVFLTRSLRRRGWLPLCTCYFMVAASPEVWISGSAYINDKIVATTFLFGALVLVQARARDDGGPLRPTIFLAGMLLGMGIAARFDTLVFLPAAVAAFMAEPVSTVRRWWLGLCAFVGAAGATVLVIWASMGASLRGALNAGVNRVGWSLAGGKLAILLSAFGPAQLVLCAMTVVLGLRYAMGSPPQWSGQGDGQPPADRRAGTAAGLRYVSVCLLLLPELALFLLFPFSSQKYLLTSSAVAAGLCGVILPGLLSTARGVEERGGGLDWAAHAAVIAFIAASFLVGFGRVEVGQDGPRPLGGQAFFRMPRAAGARDARRTIERLESARSCAMPIVMMTPSWVLEESLAYECAVRGWTYGLQPAGSRMTWDEARIDEFFRDLSTFWEDHGLRRPRVIVQVATYTPPGATSPAILVPEDRDLAFGLVRLP